MSTIDIRAVQPLLVTDRGELMLAKGADGTQRLLRVLDPRLADKSFRDALEQLAESTRQEQPPRILQILKHTRIGDHYFIEYKLDTPCRAATEHFNRLHWLDRLDVVRDVCQFYEKWRACIPVPLGLHLGGIVFGELAGHWLPHLAPCAPIAFASPYDLMNVHPAILVAVAPERIRGMPSAGPVEDMFGAGILALQTFRENDTPHGSPEDRVEAQARASLFADDSSQWSVEAALRGVPSIESKLKKFRRVARRCVEFRPEGRPANLSELREACEALLRLKAPDDVVEELVQEGKPEDALRLLEWSISMAGEQTRRHLRAAELCEELGRKKDQLFHLERALGRSRHEPGLARKTMDLAYELYRAQPSSVDRDTDTEGDRILELLEALTPPSGVTLDPEDRAQAKEDRFRAAMIHGRRGDLYVRARTLFEATQLEWTDLDTIFLYGLSLKNLSEHHEDRDQVKRKISQLLQEAAHRLRRLVEAQQLEEEDVKSWTERFESLRL